MKRRDNFPPLFNLKRFSLLAFGVNNMWKIMAFIDGTHLYNTMNALSQGTNGTNRLAIDFKKLALWIESGFDTELECDFRVVRTNYFNMIPPTASAEEQQTIRPLLDWLEYNGYTVFTRNYKVSFDTRTNETRKIGNTNVLMTTKMLEVSSTLNEVLLFAGDSDFCEPVEALQRQGIRVTLVSSLGNKSGSTAMVADSLRKQADTFIDLEDILPKILKKD